MTLLETLEYFLTETANETTSAYTTCSTERSYGNCGIMRNNWEAKE